MLGPFLLLLFFAAVLAVMLAAIGRMGRLGQLLLIGITTGLASSTLLMIVLFNYFGDIRIEEVAWRSVACGAVGAAAAWLFGRCVKVYTDRGH